MLSLDKFDVVIVGAGVAGSSAAYFLSKKGLKVLITDVKKWDRIGDKPCGDAMGKHHFDELGIDYPKEEELEGLVKGIIVYSPSEGTAYKVLGEGFEVNRIKFTQRFLKEAIDNGATFMEGTQVSKPVFKDGRIIEVILWSRKEGSKTVSTKFVIDASGMSRSLARQLPRDWPIAEPIDPKDFNVAYREIRLLKEPIEDPEFLRIYVSQRVAPGGYWWFFPYSLKEGYVNVGLGVQGGMGHPNPKDLLYRYVISRPEFKDSKIVESGGAAVPTRKPLPSLVWENVAVIGDAAYTVNPVHGGGKGSAILSAYCVTEALSTAFEEGTITTSSIWSANKCYMERYGAKQAALDVFRLFLQYLSDEDLEYGMSRKLIKEEDLNTVSLKGDLELSVVEKAMRLLAGLGRPSFLIKLRAVAKYMNTIKMHYLNYPDDVEEFSKWYQRSEELFNEFKAKVLG